jgi:hypothetical protein
MSVLTDNFQIIYGIVEPRFKSRSRCLVLDLLTNPNARTDPVTSIDVFNFTTSSRFENGYVLGAC